MRELIVTENITVDGVIEADDWFSVADDADMNQSDLVATLLQQAAESDAVLFGRSTFEDMRGYWPKQVDDPTGVAEHLNKTTEYVVSGTLGEPEWGEHGGAARPTGRADPGGAAAAG